ncbi:MAG: hypothetical protein JF616_10665 [Fibrobacteres bacterium]|nr:hypothetical protein [Fibrobacterota bacterium]
MKRKLIFLLGLVPLLSSCADDSASSDPEALPAWVESRISQYKAERVADPPREIIEFDHGGSKVYLVSSDCCDQYDSLFDANQRYICAPSGGLGGLGDGKCDAVFDEHSAGRKVVWKDDRSL